jgi:DhnA family fructose-bisphosphate aldolase class Ia
MRRIFRRRRAVIVPLDHPLFYGPIRGLENPVELVRKVAEGGADGVLLTPGTLDLVADVLGDLAVVLRIDGTHTRLGKHLERIDLISSVREAARMGVEAVVLNIFVGADNEDALLNKLGRVAEDCREHGVLLVGEMIPEAVLKSHYGTGSGEMTNEQRAEMIALASRCGAEIGADIIKTAWSGSAESFESVTRTATRPVLVAGGPKSGDDASQLRMIGDALRAGAAGVCVGRNVWQRDDMSRMLAKVCEMVHGD